MPDEFLDPSAPKNLGLVKAYLARAVGADVDSVAGSPALLQGGVENRNYKVNAVIGGAGSSFVLRFPPKEIPAWRTVADPDDPGENYDLGREFRILREIRAFELHSPRAYAFDAEGTTFGAPCLLMECLPGERLFDHVYPELNETLLRELALYIARIVRMPFASSPWLRDSLPKWPRARFMDWWKWLTRAHAGDGLYRHALAWLKEREPATGAYVLHHGDPNPTNFLVANGRVEGVVDWEFASLVDDPLAGIDVFCYGYYRNLLDRGLGKAYCEAIGRSALDLEWYKARGVLFDAFPASGPALGDLHPHRRKLAEITGYGLQPGRSVSS